MQVILDDRAEKRLRMRHLRAVGGSSAGKSRLEQEISNVKSIAENICYLPGGRSVWEKTVPEVLSTARGRRPRAVLKTKGTVFSHTDRPSPVNNIFIFSYSTLVLLSTNGFVYVSLVIESACAPSTSDL